MDTKIFQDENGFCQFDFSAALRASNQLNPIFQQNTSSLLSDIDFLVETEDEIIFVEYKNANVPGCSKPEAMTPSNQKLQNKLAFKYYDSWLYIHATNCRKPITYVCVVEFYQDDSRMRLKLREAVTRLLPFRLQKLENVKHMMIQDFHVLSVDEWNCHDHFKRYPITRIFHT